MDTNDLTQLSLPEMRELTCALEEMRSKGAPFKILGRLLLLREYDQVHVLVTRKVATVSMDHE